MTTVDVLEPLPATPDLASIRSEVEKVRWLSDRLIKLGPVNMGLDGLITWIPGAGLIYTLGAGGYLLVLARRAGAPKRIIARMIGWLAMDTATSEIPIIGDAVDFFFRGHAKAASTLLAWLDTVDPQPKRVGRWRDKISLRKR